MILQNVIIRLTVPNVGKLIFILYNQNVPQHLKAEKKKKLAAMETGNSEIFIYTFRTLMNSVYGN